MKFVAKQKSISRAGRSGSISSPSELEGESKAEEELIEELSREEANKKVIKRVELLLPLQEELELMPPLPGVVEVVELDLVDLEPPSSLECIPSSLNCIKVVPAIRKRGRTVTSKVELPVVKRGRRRSRWGRK